MKNRTARMVGLQKIQLAEAEVPAFGADEVLVRIAYCGICGSDLHYFESGQYSDGEIPFPHIPGHECSGVVVDVGQNVTGLSAGDRVVIEPQISCGDCDDCRHDHYNICRDVVFRSVPPAQGMLCDYVACPAGCCHKIPESVSLLEGALVEPLAIGIHAVRRAEVGPEDTIAVLGVGCIGIMTILAARAAGVKRIIAVDLVESRLQRARSFGATDTIHSGSVVPEQELARLTGNTGADVVFETAGSPHTLKLAPLLCRGGGTILTVGCIFQEVPFHFWTMIRRELTLRGSYRYCGDYPAAIRMIAQRQIDVDRLVSNLYSFEDTQRAFLESMRDKEHTLKCVIQLWPEAE